LVLFSCTPLRKHNIFALLRHQPFSLTLLKNAAYYNIGAMLLRHCIIYINDGMDGYKREEKADTWYGVQLISTGERTTHTAYICCMQKVGALK
jgi:hypothetical protein